MPTLQERARQIKLAIFDVDGVLTDGSLLFTGSGEEIKAFHSHDGHGLKMLKATGVELAIISGRTSGCVERRAAELGIALLFQGVTDKLPVFETLLARLQLGPAACAYIGDDVVDLPILRRCGLSVCVPAAPDLVKRHVGYVTRAEGGRGAVRELCELIMQAQQTLDAQLAGYLA